MSLRSAPALSVLHATMVPACLDVDPVTPVEALVDDVPGVDVRTGDRIGPVDLGGWTPLLPGSHCAANADCDSAPDAGDGYCYRGDVGGSIVFPDDGFCTIDDGSGEVCVADVDCPAGSQCASIDGYRLCLPSCVAGACPAGQACQSSFGGLTLDAPVCLPGSATARDGDACAGFYECNADSTCWNDLENPGGYCSAYNCTVGSNAGCNGGTCIVFRDGPSTGTVCVDACTLSVECRVLEGYVCHDPDGLGGVGGYCRRPHVGDPCALSASCGSGWTCKTGVGWSGGYCTVTGCPTPGSTAGCSSGSVCSTVGGANMCVDRCAAVGSTSACRSGYTCKAVGATSGGGCLAP
jgi:hypothetical protein